MAIDRYLIFDESGNLGSGGRYFVIACIDTTDYKALNNVMKRKLGKAKLLFPALAKLHSHEIKAKDAYPCVKYHILEVIAAKNLTISYIVADLKHVKPSLLKEKNIFYNYMMKLLVESLITSKDKKKSIQIIYDNHSTKVGSLNSMDDYLRLDLNYEKGYDIDLSFKRMDSDASDAYPVQAADYVANALYAKYEYDESVYYNLFKHIIHSQLRFPTKKFGKN